MPFIYSFNTHLPTTCPVSFLSSYSVTQKNMYQKPAVCKAIACGAACPPGAATSAGKQDIYQLDTRITPKLTPIVWAQRRAEKGVSATHTPGPAVMCKCGGGVSARGRGTSICKPGATAQVRSEGLREGKGWHLTVTQVLMSSGHSPSPG